MKQSKKPGEFHSERWKHNEVKTREKFICGCCFFFLSHVPISLALPSTVLAERIQKSDIQSHNTYIEDVGSGRQREGNSIDGEGDGGQILDRAAVNCIL